MWKLLGCCWLLLVLVVCEPGPVIGQKKDKKATDTAPQGTPQEYAQLNQVKEITGKLTYADAGSKTLSFKLEFQNVEPNPNFKPGSLKGGAQNQQYQHYVQMQKLMAQQQQAAAIANPVQRQQKLYQINMQLAKLQMQMQIQSQPRPGKNGTNPNNQNGPFKVTTTSKSFDLDIADKVVVRRLNLPTEYDDKGNIKEFTKEEIKKLRGTDTSKPGYAAKYDDLAPGQVVKLTLSPANAEKNKTGKKLLDDDDGVGNVAKPTITMIVIVDDSLGMPVVDPKKEKKKK